MEKDRSSKAIRPGSVLRLSDYRKSTSVAPKSLVFYVNNKNSLKKTIEKIPSIGLFSIQSMPDLLVGLSIKTPDLLLIEADLTWLSPLIILKEAQRFFEVPSVLLCRDKSSIRSHSLIREAYRCGLYDVLFAPFTQEELKQSLDLILRLNQLSEAPSL